MLRLFITLLGKSVKAQSVFYALCSHRAIVSAEDGVEWDTDKTSHADSLHFWALFGVASENGKNRTLRPRGGTQRPEFASADLGAAVLGNRLSS